MATRRKDPSEYSPTGKGNRYRRAPGSKVGYRYDGRVPVPGEVINRPPPETEDLHAMAEWNWWQVWAIRMMALKGEKWATALEAQGRLEQIARERLTLFFEAKRVQQAPLGLPSPDGETVMVPPLTRDESIVQWFQQNPYRTKDGD